MALLLGEVAEAVQSVLASACRCGCIAAGRKRPVRLPVLGRDVLQGQVCGMCGRSTLPTFGAPVPLIEFGLPHLVIQLVGVQTLPDRRVEDRSMMPQVVGD
jgi:hypothetical protein